MKIERVEKEFIPITITVETKEELKDLRFMLDLALHNSNAYVSYSFVPRMKTMLEKLTHY